jgi:hypothetical protein
LKKNTQYYEPSIEDIFAKLNSNDFEIVEIEGMNWIPLPLSSNSILVDIFKTIEKKIKLYRWINQSPWLMICVKKK